MKILAFLTLLIFTSFVSGQKFIDTKGFRSVFQDLASGSFEGTSNGILLVKNGNTESILDFQGSYAKLELVIDPDEVYDVSTKEYTGKTTSGNTILKYETYAGANSISIKLNGNWYVLTAIDGASDIMINGLEYVYKSETATEYLVIRITKTLELTIQSDVPDLKGKTIKLLPDSTIVFAIKRK